MRFEDYIKSLPIAEDFKNLILDQNFRDSNPAYYQNYPVLFSKAFLFKKNDLDYLNIAGYLYYQATLFTDCLIDEKEIEQFPLITICQEECIKILTSIYGLKSNFWKLWNKRKEEYLQALFIDKELQKKENVALEEYETLADKKSAFGKVALDCLFTIDNQDEDLYQKLLLSHKYFSVAFQLNDDIQDFKEDLRKGQFNWAVYLLQKQNLSHTDPDLLEKYLYIRGISKEMYQLGIQYCDKALSIVENIDVPEWKNTLVHTQTTFRHAILEIDNYLKALTS
ncbi:class 1 isoprenoid biosynthesis enzyme [Flavobacterium sp. MDT1-60]|uniref:class 1 isoprenoid biosynthesis enzyme n=1 Tax=Flavobacterium sp. MDT1-60 TaxID=1979344 RepID=UPI0017871495|nr:hypothetical protein [Flavobacterium sp. MDT1-60]QOG02387.1 hypothetical protein IHE43_21825 [Flavobacterium sp. MDT1-60]